MKRTLFVIVLFVAALGPILSFACPPPPDPGYSGPDVGPGPLPTGEGGYVESGGKDPDSGAKPTDVELSGVIA
jgi:hypothetical protein